MASEKENREEIFREIKVGKMVYEVRSNFIKTEEIEKKLVKTLRRLLDAL